METVFSKMCCMRTTPSSSPVARRIATAVAVAVSGLVLAACGSSSTSSEPTAVSSSAPACPVAPIKVVVTTNVWGSVVDQLVGACANVSTVITSAAADPHDFEPTAADSAAIAGAQLVVVNGLGYDEWATKIVKSLGASAPPVLNLGEELGLKTGVNPHIWYSPDYVVASSQNITTKMKAVEAGAASYFDGQAVTFSTALQPYLDKVASIKSQFTSTKIGATETVFDYMAQATGLVIATPPGFSKAIATESEPTAEDVGAFQTQLSRGGLRALIYNSQTEGSLTTQLKSAAEKNNVPVVSVTESINPPDATFQAWQLAQLDALAIALSA